MVREVFANWFAGAKLTRKTVDFLLERPQRSIGGANVAADMDAFITVLGIITGSSTVILFSL
jgi:hypothetical protein